MITFDNSGHLQQGLVRRAHQRSIKGTVQDRILVCIAQNQCVIFLRVRYYNLYQHIQIFGMVLIMMPWSALETRMGHNQIKKKKEMESTPFLILRTIHRPSA